MQAENKHSTVPKDLDKQFSVLKKCNNKFNCLVQEMLLIRELTPPLNVQSALNRAKPFCVTLHISYNYANHHPKIPFCQLWGKT